MAGGPAGWGGYSGVFIITDDWHKNNLNPLRLAIATHPSGGGEFLPPGFAVLPPRGEFNFVPRIKILPLEGVPAGRGRLAWSIRNNELIPEHCLPHEVLTKCGHSEQTTVCVGI